MDPSLVRKILGSEHNAREVITDLRARYSGAEPSERALIPGPCPGGGRFGVGTAWAWALAVGSVIGTGVFAMPSVLAVFGPISLVAFVLVTIGAVALTFHGLAARLSGAGGPYVCARDAFGEFAGFLIAWSYWITAWAGYVEVFPKDLTRRRGRLAWTVLVR